ncbi:MAG: hypothetical protein LBI13_08585 [Streptococcaceae bacterium]|jgi:hypothetical protein|nr:hypothetical protein [Streptococcaceae bacterium]
MAIIHQYDKRSGITYAYESHSYWDKEKKTSRAKRTLIGRVNMDTGEIVPTDGRCKKDKIRRDEGKNPDYKGLWEKLQKKCLAQESLINALQKELSELREKPPHV